MVDTQGAIALLHKIADLIDIAEIGTPLVMRDGMHAVCAVRSEFPQLKIFCDAKIMDVGAEEAQLSCEAGANIVSVLGVSADATIISAANAAHKHGVKILVDMIDCPRLSERAKEVDTLGVDYICVHSAIDLRKSGKNPLDDLKTASAVVKHASLAVAGGVNITTLPEIITYKPGIVIVGGAICSQNDPRAAALSMRKLIDEANDGN